MVPKDRRRGKWQTETDQAVRGEVQEWLGSEREKKNTEDCNVEGKLSKEPTKGADMTKRGWSTGFGFTQEQITRDKAKFPPRLSCTCTNCCLSLQIKVMSAVR